MASYRLSKQANHDLSRIVMHSIKEWGAKQASRYVSSLHALFELLVARPGVGREVKSRPGVRRIEHVSHIVLYREVGQTIVVIRLLHKHQLLPKHK